MSRRSTKCQLGNASFQRFRDAYLDEDDGRRDGHEAVELQKNTELVLFAFGIQVELLDTLNSKLLMLESELVGVGRERLCVADDLIGESSGEKDDLGVLRKEPARN